MLYGQDNYKLSIELFIGIVMEYTTDILIIGAGPVGIFGAYQAGFLGMKTIIVDALEQPGGQLNALYPSKYIYDIPGYPAVLAGELIDNLIKQADKYTPCYLMSRTVSKFTRNQENNLITITTSKNDIIHTKAVIIAAGAGAFEPNRLPFEGSELLEGKSVHYFVKDPMIFQDQTLLIAGGGDSALDWALNLKNIAKKVIIIHRRNKFRGSPASVAELYQAADDKLIEIMIPYTLEGINIKDNKLTSVVLKNSQGFEDIEVDSLLAFYGLVRDLGEIANWDLDINKLHSSIKVDNGNYETNIPGVFAVGDVASYEYKLKLISVGFGEIAVAIHSTWKYVFPDQVFHFVHSTAQ